MENKSSRVGYLFSAGILILIYVLLAGASTQATLKYKKDTGKKCTYCHTSIPEKGDEDPKLTEDGKEFKKNGYRLTEKQKQSP